MSTTLPGPIATLAGRLAAASALPSSLPKTLMRVTLGGVLVFAGASHLTVGRTEFLAQVPSWVPLSADLVVILSGVAEIAIGLALVALSRRRAAVGLVAAAFFVAIFPGNVSQYLNGVDAFGLSSDGARLGRLFFQPLLVAWALWATDAWRVFVRGRA